MRQHPPHILVAAAAALCCSFPVVAQEADPVAKPLPQVETEPEGEVVDRFESAPAAVLGFRMRDINGEEVELSEYAGKVVLMVNVASECGLTLQYEALQAVFERYQDRGLVVLGFPANNFMGQEPGTDAEILEFCTGTYQVSFPMMSKISVIGEDQHPLYAKLAAAMEEQGGEPTWNFTKYLVDRKGLVVRRFDPRTVPDDAEVIVEIERLLAEPVPAGDPHSDDETTIR